MADGELLDAREAMALLGINETELQALVARGDLRAFRSSGTMKFRRDDVTNVKTDKGTEPTIIVPTAGLKKPAAPGFAKSAPALKSGPGGKPAASGLPELAPSSRPAPPAPAGGKKKESGSSGDVLIDDFELVPTDDVANTQQVTVQQPAIAASGPNEKTVLDTNPTSETLVDSQLGQEAAAARPAQTRSASSRATAPSGSGVASALPAAPAMSRVRAAATSGVQSSASKRVVIAQARSAGPLVTAVLILTAVVFLYTLSLVGVMMARGTYDDATGERVIPPYLSDNSALPVYSTFYTSTPGRNLNDRRPQSEFPKPSK